MTLCLTLVMDAPCPPTLRWEAAQKGIPTLARTKDFWIRQMLVWWVFGRSECFRNVEFFNFLPGIPCHDIERREKSFLSPRLWNLFTTNGVHDMFTWGISPCQMYLWLARKMFQTLVKILFQSLRIPLFLEVYLWRNWLSNYGSWSSNNGKWNDR